MKKSGGAVEQLGLRGQCEILLEAGDALAEREVLRKLHEADQISAALATVTVEQIFTGIDVKRRLCIRVQRAEPNEFLARADAPSGPVVPPQVVQQWHPLFELFQIRAHGFDLVWSDAILRIGLRSDQGWRRRSLICSVESMAAILFIQRKPRARQEVVVGKIPEREACAVEVFPRSRLVPELSCCWQDVAVRGPSPRSLRRNALDQ